jgi:CHAT domain-containing protein
VYGSGQQITGEQATRETVLAAVEQADVLHIAAHASIAGNDPAKSHLVLAPSALDSGALYLRDIRHAKRGQLVILAGCHTAAKSGGRRNISTLANAFLAAGASNAIGTLWQIEDEAAADFAIRFHQNIANHQTAAAALRETQLAMIRSTDPRLRRSSIWSSFQLYGSGD